MYATKFIHFIFIIVLLFEIISADDSVQERKKHKYKHHLVHGGGLYYLAFLAIKIKLVLVLGTIFAFVVFGGKIFALLKYLELKTHSAQSPIIYSPPSHYDHPSFEDHYSRRIASENSNFQSSYRKLDDSSFNKFLDIMSRINFTNKAFEQMGITEESCRKKFICKIEQAAKTNPMLKLGISYLSDSEYKSYKPTQIIKSTEDCNKYFSDCTEN